jgi:hypothetical protein
VIDQTHVAIEDEDESMAPGEKNAAGKVMVDEMQLAIEDKEKSKETVEDNKMARRWWLILCQRMSVQWRDGLEQQCFIFHPCLLFNSSVLLDHILTFPLRGIIEWADRWITVLNCEGLNITPSPIVWQLCISQTTGMDRFFIILSTQI